MPSEMEAVMRGKKRRRKKSKKPSSKTSLTPHKARKILHDKSVRGHPLTAKQRRFMGAVASRGGK